MPIIQGGNVIAGAQRRDRTPLDKVARFNSGYGFTWAKASYTFAGQGGGTGTIALFGSTDIPSGARIMGGFVDVTTLLTGAGGATGALQVEGANDLVSATVISGAPWSTTGMKTIIPVFGTVSTWLKTTAARDISFVIAVAAVTAGAFDVYLAYLPPVEP